VADPWTGDLTVRYQTQAVLRRTSRSAPLVLVGITLDGTFFPRSPEHATGRLVMTKGLVALAPLSAVEAPDPTQAAAIAIVDARATWNGPDSLARAGAEADR
jgi:hypothetical protein